MIVVRRLQRRNRLVASLGFHSLRSLHPRLYKFVAVGDRKSSHVYLSMRFSLNLIFITVLLCAICVETNAQGLPLASPRSVGMNAARLDQIEQLVNADIADKKL